MLMKPDLMFLSLGITTFYRKSFTFESQVSECIKCPNPISILGIAHTLLFSWMSCLETGPILLHGPPPARAGPGVSGGRCEGQEL